MVLNRLSPQEKRLPARHFTTHCAIWSFAKCPNHDATSNISGSNVLPNVCLAWIIKPRTEQVPRTKHHKSRPSVFAHVHVWMLKQYLKFAPWLRNTYPIKPPHAKLLTGVPWLHYADSCRHSVTWCDVDEAVLSCAFHQPFPNH